MNFSKSILAITLAGVVFVGCKDKTNATADSQNSSTKAKKEITAANLQTASFSIDGMTCAIGCAKTIEKELSGLDGVQDATIDFDKKTGIVSYDKSILKSENITKVVEDAGDGKTYKVSNMKL